MELVSETAAALIGCFAPTASQTRLKSIALNEPSFMNFAALLEKQAGGRPMLSNLWQIGYSIRVA
jgi:hypothetical protein